MINYQRVGRRIQMTRQLRGMTMVDLADKAGIPLLALEDVERGECQEHATIDAVCRALDVDTGYVLDPSDPAATARAWGSLSPEEINRAHKILDKMQKGPGA